MDVDSIMGAKLLGVAASIGLAIAGWEKIKGIFARFYSIFVVKVRIEGHAAYAMCAYVSQHFHRSKLGELVVTGRNIYVRPKKRNQLVGFKKIPQASTVYWRGLKPMSIKREWDNVQISFMRGMFNRETFVTEAINYFNNQEFTDVASGRFFVERKQGSIGDKPYLKMMGKKNDDDKGGGDDNESPLGRDKRTAEVLGWTYDEIGDPVPEHSMDRLCLEPHVTSAIAEIVSWKTNEKWFKDHGIPWKWGCLLVGPPGTGKTAACRALGQTLDMPIFLLDLATMNNRDLVEAWNQVMDWSPCIVLIEDIHAVFTLAQNIVNTGEEAGLTFDCLLNVIDGIENSEGILTIITSNNAATVDVALGGGGCGQSDVTRPGRINRTLMFNPLTAQGREKMARRILGDFQTSKWESVLGEVYKGSTGAQFQDVCCVMALDLWKKENGGNDEE